MFTTTLLVSWSGQLFLHPNVPVASQTSPLDRIVLILVECIFCIPPVLVLDKSKPPIATCIAVHRYRDLAKTTVSLEQIGHVALKEGVGKTADVDGGAVRALLFSASKKQEPYSFLLVNLARRTTRRW